MRWVSILLVLAACAPERPVPEKRSDGTVRATVASFRVVTAPGGAETIEKIAVSQGIVRFPAETDVWRLFDIETETVTIVDEIDHTVERESFSQILERLRSSSREGFSLPVARVESGEETELVAGFTARRYGVSIGRGYHRDLWISRRPLFHSRLFLLRLATESVRDEDMPALRNLIELLGEMEGYPVIDRATMIFDDEEYTIERRLIAVADQSVPARWFELPLWAERKLKAPPVDPQPDASPLAGRSTREEESRPSGSVRTTP